MAIIPSEKAFLAKDRAGGGGRIPKDNVIQGRLGGRILGKKREVFDWKGGGGTALTAQRGKKTKKFVVQGSTGRNALKAKKGRNRIFMGGAKLGSEGLATAEESTSW